MSYALWLKRSFISVQNSCAPVSAKASNRYCVYVMTCKTPDRRLSYGDNWPSWCAAVRSSSPGLARWSCHCVRWYAWPVAECSSVISPSRQSWPVNCPVRRGNRFSICCHRRALNVTIHRWVASRALEPLLFPGWLLIDNVAASSRRFLGLRLSVVVLGLQRFPSSLRRYVSVVSIICTLLLIFNFYYTILAVAYAAIIPPRHELFRPMSLGLQSLTEFRCCINLISDYCSLYKK